MEKWTFGQIKNNGFQNEFQEGFAELTPDAGANFRRQRFSDIQDIIQGAFTLTKLEYLRFMSWYKFNIRQGSIPFLYYDCRVGRERVTRILGKPTFNTNSKYYDVNITLTFDSEIIYIQAPLLVNPDKPLLVNPDKPLYVGVKLRL